MVEAAVVDPFGHARESMIYGCRSVDCYARLGKIDEGTYGVVTKARDKETNEIVALKQVKMAKEICKEGFPITALREINILLRLQPHPNIIRVREMVMGGGSSSLQRKIYMVMDYCDLDLKVALDPKPSTTTPPSPLLVSEVKCLLQQLLSAVAFMHDRWFIHRDLKTSNLLYDQTTGLLKVCDFGMARTYGSPLNSYTQLVVTLHYRAPELLLGAKTYDTAVDMWSVGCIFAELLRRKTLFPGQGEINQLDLIFKTLGAPTVERWPAYESLPHTANIKWRGVPTESKLHTLFASTSTAYGTDSTPLSSAGLDLLSRMLCLDPSRRISAADALKHVYFTQTPVALHPSDLPKEL